MLRNGQRAIMLGPRRMPFFIWWCVVDQRLAMWTTLFSPLLALSAALKYGMMMMVQYMIYLAITRMLLSIILFTYSEKVDLNYIWALPANQKLNANVKVYMLWRLARQKWANRGNQSSGAGGTDLLSQFRNGMAVWLTAVSYAGLFIGVIVYTELLTVPSMGFVRAFFGI